MSASSEKVSRVLSESSGAIRLPLVDKITLPDGMHAFDVHMLEKGQLILCQPEEKVFFFTDGLKPCVAAMLYCELSSGVKIIGVTHLSADSNADFSGDILEKRLDEEDVIELINKKFFHPRKLQSLIDLIKNLDEYQQEPINMYFAGGSGGQWLWHYYRLYCAHVESIENVQLKGVVFDPYSHWNSDSWLNLGDMATIAGITSDGIPVVTRSRNVFLGDILDKRNTQEAFEHFVDQNDTARMAQPMVAGFTNLTKQQLQTSKRQFLQVQSGVLQLKSTTSSQAFERTELEQFGHVIHHLDSHEDMRNKLLDEIYNILLINTSIDDTSIFEKIIPRNIPYSFRRLEEIKSIIQTDTFRNFLIQEYKNNRLASFLEESTTISFMFDTASALEALSDAERKKLIDELGVKHFSTHLLRASDLIKILKILSPEDQLKFMGDMEETCIIELTQDDRELFSFFEAGISKNILQKIIIILDESRISKCKSLPYLIRLVAPLLDESSLRDFMSKFNIKSIQDDIKNIPTLIRILCTIPDLMRWEFIREVIGKEKIQQLLENITHSEHFTKLIATLPECHIAQCLVTIIEHPQINTLFPTPDKFRTIMAQLPDNIRLIMMTNVLGEDTVRNILIKTRDDIHAWLEIFPLLPDDWKFSLTDFKWLQSNITHPSNFLSLLNSVNQTDRFEFLKQFDAPWLKNLLTSDYWYRRLLTCLPVQEQPYFEQLLSSATTVAVEHPADTSASQPASGSPLIGEHRDTMFSIRNFPVKPPPGNCSGCVIS